MENTADNRFSLIEIDGAPADDAAKIATEVRDIVTQFNPATVPLPAPIQTPAPAAPKVENRMIAVSAPSESTGAVVYWQLSGVVNLEALHDAWLAAGLDELLLPEAVSPAVALSRAVKELQGRDVLIRKHPRGGWAVVCERKDGNSLSYGVGARVYLEGDKVQFSAEEYTVEETATVSASVLAEYGLALTSFSTIDISSWLVWLAGKLSAVPLRERGGIYFVPRDSVATVRKIKAALAGISANVVHEIPAMHSAEAVSAVLDALTREANTEIQAVEDEVTGEISRCIANNRIGRIADLERKILSYEDLLGVDFGDFKTRISAIRSKLATKATRIELLEVN